MSQLFAGGAQSTGVSALASFLPKKSQGWSPSEWTMPGASMRNPAHDKGHDEGSPTKCKGVIWLRGFPLGFPEHLPAKNQTLPAFLYCAFPLFWHSLGKVNLGLQLSAFERNVSAQTPSDGSLNLPNRFPQTFYNLWNVYSPPTARSTKLKAS